MKIVVLGGTGLIGSRLIPLLVAAGHEAIAASPTTGVDTLTTHGLAATLDGAEAVVDVTNAPDFDHVAEFFDTSTRNALEAARQAGVTHYVLLSIVGTDAVPDSAYLTAKAHQEQLVRDSGVPFTIVRATQFFEFIPTLADAATIDGTVHATAALLQPIAADDVAAALATVIQDALASAATSAVNSAPTSTATSPEPGDPASKNPPTPAPGTIELAGPEQFTQDDLIRRALDPAADPRPVVTSPGYTYLGSPVARDTLLPGPAARLGTTRYEEWAS
ncbi:SDR family oxidoreductase [Herbiconiux solani]|uniref:SDR family oxidoreductase n=1 Tax=Herbiconiux solani TaxID=661329 RepID=UPI0008255C6D|nr:NAD(P)H-binding protein [Herbiconiux solani]